MKTFWDEEQERKRQKEDQEKITRLLGRETDIPRKLKGKKIAVHRIDPEELLKQGGYQKNFERGWVKWIDKDYRFHIYFSRIDNIISIHTDKVVQYGRHVACDYQIDEEIARLKALIPTKRMIRIRDTLPSSKQKEALRIIKNSQ